MKSKAFFFLPIAYFLHSRIASFTKFISWLIIFCIPTFYIVFNFSPLPLVQTSIIYILQLLIVYTFYEVGYIQNDCETIKNEINPTLRLSVEELQFYEQYKVAIYISRILLGFAMLFSLLLINPFSQGTFMFGGLAVSILVVYQLYNRVRSKLTLVLHFLLVCLRFLSFPFIFFSVSQRFTTDVACLVLIFPLINLIERGSNKKFDVRLFQMLIKDKASIAGFRVVYYAVTSLLIIMLMFLDLIPNWILYLNLYFLVYRFMIVKANINS